jgi:hypothetical protein
MGKIEQNGFLSEEIQQWVEKHRRDNTKWFSLCEEINKFSHKVMLATEVHENDLIELIAATLLVRAMSNFQGMLILAERGMKHESEVLLRSLLERTFAMVAIDKNKQVGIVLIFNDLFRRKRLLNTTHRNLLIGNISDDNQKFDVEIDKEIGKINEEISERVVREYNIKDSACDAGMTEVYDTEYKLLSGSLHVNVRDMERHLKINESKNVKKILWGPDTEGIDFILFSGAEKMLLILTAVAHIFSLDYDNEWELILKTYNELGKQYSAKQSKNIT